MPLLIMAGTGCHNVKSYASKRPLVYLCILVIASLQSSLSKGFWISILGWYSNITYKVSKIKKVTFSFNVNDFQKFRAQLANTET